MFGSKRGFFSAERGSTTSWLAGITSVALLIGTVALPAVATEGDPSAEPTTAAQSQDPAPELTSESTPVEESAPAEEPAADEAIIGDGGLEDEAPAAEEPSASSSDSASDAPSDTPAADKPAADATDEPTKDSSAPATSGPAASSSDGTTPDNNSPPVEEFVPGMKAYPGDGRATIAWPDFGTGENYVVQIEKSNGDWKTVTSDVTDPDSALPKYLDNQATIKDLKNGKEYQVRVVSAAHLAEAEAATEPAVDVAGAGKGSSARIPMIVRSTEPGAPITSQIQTVTPAAYKLTLVARYCNSYTDIQRNRADNNLRETFAQLGAVANPPYTDTMANNPITPAREALKNINCLPLNDWQFTLGTGITGGTPSDPSIVTGAYGGTQPRTVASVPELDASGSATGSNVAGAVTVSLTQDQITKVQSSSSLWIQGGKPVKGANYTGKQVNQDETKFQKADGTAKYAFATLRCVVDNLNGDNVEWAYYSNSVRHGFCYAYYVDNPNFGTIVIKKRVDGTDPVQGGTTFDYTGTVSYFANGAFSLKDGESQTFEREPRDDTGDKAWTVKETSTTGWTLKDLACTSSKGSKTTTDKATGEATIALKQGDRVECTYTNTRTVPPAVPAVEKVVKRGNTTLTDASTVAPGDVLTYAVTVKNNAGAGGAALSGTVEDTPDLSYVSNPTAISDSGVFTAPKITWTVTNLAAGATKTFTYQVTVKADAPDKQNVTNFVVFKTPVGNPEDRTTNPITNPAKPGLVKSTTTASPLSPGSAVDYKVTLTNTGGAAVTSDLVDTLPIGLTYRSGSASTLPDSVSPDKRTITWNSVEVGSGATFTVTYTADVAADVADGTWLSNGATWAEKFDSVTVQVRTGTIEVTKTDTAEQPKPLAGAVFQLWTAVKDGDALVKGLKVGEPSAPTGDDGLARWDNLPWGSYFVEEITAPVGYGLSAGGMQLVTIDRDTFQCDDDRVALSQDRDLGDDTVECGGIEYATFANPPIDIPSLDKTSDPSDGTAVETGGTIAYTIKVKNEGALPLTEQTLVDTLPTGTTLDVASVTPAGDTSVAGKITWTFDLGAFSEKTFTYKVKVTAGFGSAPLVNTADWVQKKLTDKTTNPVKAISAVTTSFCVKDAPYYSVAVKSQNLTNVNDTVTVRWYQANDQGQPIDAQGNPTTDPTKFVAAYNPANGGTPATTPYVDTYKLADGALNIPQILWKGAAVDSSGAATVWPGWEQPSPGVWKQVPSGGVRPGMFAIVTVNPTAQTAALYPPAAAPCANPPGVPKVDKTADPTEGTTVNIGQTINYSILVTNTGGSKFTGPMVDTLPAGVTVNGTISDGGVLSGNTITWQVTLEAGASKTFTYPVLVGTTATGNVINTVVLTTPAGPISDSTTNPVAVVAGVEEVVPDEEVVAAEEDEDLAATGANNVGNLVGAALLAMLAGGLMVTFGRRRRNEG